GRQVAVDVVVAVDAGVDVDGQSERIERKTKGSVTRVVDRVGAQGAEAAECAASWGGLTVARELDHTPAAAEEDALAAGVHVGREYHLAVIVKLAGFEVVDEVPAFRPRCRSAEESERLEVVAWERPVLQTFDAQRTSRAAASRALDGFSGSCSRSEHWRILKI